MTPIAARVRRALNPRYASLPADWFERSLRILDAGAGPFDARIAKQLVPTCRFEAVNIAPLDPDRAGRRAFDAYHTADLDTTDLAFLPDHAYDYVICSHTIEHLQDGLPVVERLCAKVAPGGRLYLEWPSPASEAFPLRGVGLHFRDDATHRRTYSLEAVAERVRAAGLSIEYAGPRRHWLRIALAPALLLYHAVRRREVKLYDLWDISGFALTVRAHRRSV